MKENENNELERLADKAMQGLPLETPSFDFTARVMAQTAAIPKKTEPVYVPLLPGYFWLLLAVALAGLLGYAYFAEGATTPVSEGIGLKALYGSALDDMASTLQFSKTTMYAAVALLLSVLAQIPIVRSRFNAAAR